MAVSYKQWDQLIMYCLPIMCKMLIVCRFILDSYQCSTKPHTEVISKNLQNHILSWGSVYNKSWLYPSFKKFWIA